VIGYGRYIIGPPFQVTPDGIGFDGEIKHQWNPVRTVSLGGINDSFRQEFGILEHFVSRFIDQKGAVNPCVWHPGWFFRSFSPIGVDQQLFGHWESPFIFD
jgi:hypothetical protein